MTLHIRGLSSDFVSIEDDNAKDCLHVIKDIDPAGMYFGFMEDAPRNARMPLEQFKLLVTKLAEFAGIAEDHSTEIERLLEASRQDGARIEELVGKLARQREQLEQKFVEQVMEYHQGCDDGKREFLRSIGLKPPKCEYTVTFTFEAYGDDDSVITEVQRNIEGGYNVNDSIEEFEVLNVEARMH